MWIYCELCMGIYDAAHLGLEVEGPMWAQLGQCGLLIIQKKQ